MNDKAILPTGLDQASRNPRALIGAAIAATGIAATISESLAKRGKHRGSQNRDNDHDGNGRKGKGNDNDRDRDRDRERERDDDDQQLEGQDKEAASSTAPERHAAAPAPNNANGGDTIDPEQRALAAPEPSSGLPRVPGAEDVQFVS